MNRQAVHPGQGDHTMYQGAFHTVRVGLSPNNKCGHFLWSQDSNINIGYFK